MAAGYSSNVPSGDNLFWSMMWELSVDRARCIGNDEKGQWSQPAETVVRKALWLLVGNFQDIWDGGWVQAYWDPLLEFPGGI